MKGKFGLLALLALLLMAVVSSGTVLAANPVPLNAVGLLTTVVEGDVDPAGGSGRSVVGMRSISGTMVGPDLWGPFSVDFDTNVDPTQSGQLHGTMTVGDYEAAVQGESELLTGPVLALLSADPLVVVPVVYLGVSGTFTFTVGPEGHASFDGGVWIIVTPDGHIVDVLPAGSPLLDLDLNPVGISGPSQVSISGQWHN